MKPFRYGADALCLAACSAYAVNRWLIKPNTAWPFFHSHFNDLLLIPAALPFVLWLERRLGLRRGDHPPSFAEIAGHWAIWSLMAEGIAPLLFPNAVGDPRDVAAYAIGAAAAAVWWHRGSAR